MAQVGQDVTTPTKELTLTLQAFRPPSLAISLNISLFYPRYPSIPLKPALHVLSGKAS